jgi:DNA-binding LytR/AlgR family response regulator
MKLLIVEDEPPIARYIESCCRDVLNTKIRDIHTVLTLDEACKYLFEHSIDICLLDLDLQGENGYELLKMAVSGSFYTIIISAHTERAIEAFEYGVLDFVAKPFDEERLHAAFGRYFDRLKNNDMKLQYVFTRKQDGNVLLAVEDIDYFQADGVYVEAHLTDGRVELLNKTMDLQFVRCSSFIFIDHISLFTINGTIKSVIFP